MPNGRCRMHGGSTPSGIALPQFKTGRYSKALPTRLLDRYHEGLNDRDLLALTDEIAVVNARLGELVGQLDSGGQEEKWEAITTGLDFCEAAIQAKDMSRLLGHLAAMREVVRQGQADGLLWEEIGNWMERARKLRETEQRRLSAMQQMITADQAMTLMAVIVETVREHVTDPDALRAISNAVRRLANVPSESA